MTTSKVSCPKCGSEQLTATKKGFSGKKAVAGAVLTGGIGLLAGTIGSNKIIITCLSCGNQFKPGVQAAEPTVQTSKPLPGWTTGSKIAVAILGIIVLAFIIGIAVAS